MHWHTLQVVERRAFRGTRIGAAKLDELLGLVSIAHATSPLSRSFAQRQLIEVRISSERGTRGPAVLPEQEAVIPLDVNGVQRLVRRLNLLLAVFRKDGPFRGWRIAH